MEAVQLKRITLTLIATLLLSFCNINPKITDYLLKLDARDFYNSHTDIVVRTKFRAENPTHTCRYTLKSADGEIDRRERVPVLSGSME